MTEGQAPCLYVDYKDAVNIDVDAFVAHDQLPLNDVLPVVLVPLAVLSHLHVHITDVQLVLPIYQEHLFFRMVINLRIHFAQGLVISNLEEVEPELVIPLVRYHVEEACVID